MESITAGDVVLCFNGKDDGLYVVVKADDKFVYLVNGKNRKVVNPKKKSLKHVKKVKSAVLIGLAEKIQNGSPVSDKRVRRSISSVED